MSRSDAVKSERQKLVKRADEEFSLYIRKRDNYTCYTCGKTGSEKDGEMQCGHLFSRVNYATRWDEANGFCQCRGCNMRHEHDPHFFVGLFIHREGLEKYDRLYIKHRQAVKFSSDDLKQLANYYKIKREALC